MLDGSKLLSEWLQEGTVVEHWSQKCVPVMEISKGGHVLAHPLMLRGSRGKHQTWQTHLSSFTCHLL